MHKFGEVRLVHGKSNAGNSQRFAADADTPHPLLHYQASSATPTWPGLQPHLWLNGDPMTVWLPGHWHCSVTGPGLALENTTVLRNKGATVKQDKISGTARIDAQRGTRPQPPIEPFCTTPHRSPAPVFR